MKTKQMLLYTTAVEIMRGIQVLRILYNSEADLRGSEGIQQTQPADKREFIVHRRGKYDDLCT